MAGEGCLAYKRTDGRLAYKKAGGDAGKLVFKVNAGGPTTIQFTWGNNGSDLDIMAYWSACGTDSAIGWNHGTTSTTEVSKEIPLGGNIYYVTWSGDKRGPTGEEYVIIRKKLWSVGSNDFLIRLNFYGYDTTDYPATTCTVSASQVKGKTLFLDNVPCGTNEGKAAQVSDPGVKISFDTKGNLTTLTTL